MPAPALPFEVRLSDRLPLLPGKSTPEGITRILHTFGENPFGEPKYRVIWSTRKQCYFIGEAVPEYAYLSPCWVLETWVPAEKFAGKRINWGIAEEKLMGPYPSRGEYFFAGQFHVADEETVRLYCVALEKTKDTTQKERVDAKREDLQKREQQKIQEVAEAIMELQDSASEGRIQQGAGPKNNFRTVDDFERDDWKRTEHIPGLPKRGGKIVQGVN